MKRIQRTTGAVIGSAVGDALGGPFEFGPPGAFSARFPAPATGGEMCGGGGWDPGEATDDTQMAILVAQSLLERGGLDLPDIFARFQRWAVSEPKDIGLQTEDVLTNGMPWDQAAALHFQVNQHAAGNGSLMRAATSAVYFAHRGQQVTMDAALPRILERVHPDHRPRYATVLAGAYYGLDAIPTRWTEPLHVPLPGSGGQVLRLPQLLELAHRLEARGSS